MGIRKGLILCWIALLVQGAVAQLPDGLYAAFDTTMGSFTCRLDYAEAPLTCANFAGLAEGSQNWLNPETGGVQDDPFYDGLIFHRVDDDFMIQSGCPLGTGTSGPGYTFPDEFTALTHHSAGILSMANAGIDSNGSQFFITLATTSWLDGRHSVFGEVVDGMDVVLNIGAVATEGERPLIDVVMNSVEILRVGTAAEAFDPVDQPLPEVAPLPLTIAKGVSNMDIIYTTSNQCEQAIYVSTNLVDWAFKTKWYWPSDVGLRANAASTNQPTEFFRAARIFYPQAIPGLASDITGHKLTFTKGISTLEFIPYAGGGGICSISRTPDTIAYWVWTPDIRSVTFEVGTGGGQHFAFQIYHGSPDNGKWNGYQWDGYNWQPIGEWSYLDTPPAP